MAAVTRLPVLVPVAGSMTRDRRAAHGQGDRLAVRAYHAQTTRAARQTEGWVGDAPGPVPALQSAALAAVPGRDDQLVGEHHVADLAGEAVQRPAAFPASAQVPDPDDRGEGAAAGDHRGGFGGDRPHTDVRRDRLTDGRPGRRVDHLPPTHVTNRDGEVPGRNEPGHPVG
ncbi:hypothetical protein ACIBKY_10885 [Nonomuraea sp. NPDC050394]|uniref:hypothetical protein n=1 Tax=Nonomuraea sp. NPDC050394 TaxID=3364363 RepID=UPI0037A70431